MGCFSLLAQRLQLGLRALLFPGCLEGERGSKSKGERERGGESGERGEMKNDK